MKYLQKTGFFAFCVGLCGLLLGLTGCASVKNVMKKTVAVFDSAAVFGGGSKKSAPKNRQEDAKKRDGKNYDAIRELPLPTEEGSTWALPNIIRILISEKLKFSVHYLKQKSAAGADFFSNTS